MVADEAFGRRGVSVFGGGGLIDTQAFLFVDIGVADGNSDGKYRNVHHDQV